MKIPRTVWALGAVSLLMDLSSELVHSLLPIFMVTVLGASMLAVGVVEGIAEATASIVKLFSGAISDRRERGGLTDEVLERRELLGRVAPSRAHVAGLPRSCGAVKCTETWALPRRSGHDGAGRHAPGPVVDSGASSLD